VKKAVANTDSRGKEMAQAENDFSASLFDATKTVATAGFDNSKIVQRVDTFQQASEARDLDPAAPGETYVKAKQISRRLNWR
jgi:hypothetical protein